MYQEFLALFSDSKLFGAKLWTIGALLVVSFACSYLPWSIRSRFKKSKWIMSYLNCLAGGVVLGALLMHMVPELSGNHNHGNALCHNHNHHHHEGKKCNVNIATFNDNIDIPTKKFIKEIDNAIGHSHHQDHSHAHEHKHECGGCEHSGHDHNPHTIQNGNTPKAQVSSQGKHGKLKHGEKAKKHAKHDHQDGHHHGFATGPFFAGVSFLLLLAIDRIFMHSHSHDHEHESESGNGTKGRTTENVMIEKNHETFKSAMLQTPTITPQHHRGHCEDVECPGGSGGVKATSLEPEDDDCASCHSEDLVGGCHMEGLDVHSSKTQALVFVMALSVHSFLEGLGMAAKNTKESLILYLISLFAHKWLEAFALGINVMNADFTTTYSFVLILFYSVLTPLGIVLGMVFEQLTLNGPYADQVMTSLNGLAVGSFMFVSCIEMIPPEFHKRTSHTPWKFITLCLGFAMMALISTFHYH